MTQHTLFEIKEDWEEEWEGMPEYRHKDLKPWRQLIVSFRNLQDYREFSKLIGQPLTPKTQSVWFPEAEIERYVDKRYADPETPRSGAKVSEEVPEIAPEGAEEGE